MSSSRSNPTRRAAVRVVPRPASASPALAFAMAVAMTTAGTRTLGAQLGSNPGAEPAPPSVFLDCQGQLPCNRDHFRTEIRFVNWARDREDADVHVIATSESVGGGGRRIVLDFIGRGDMDELSDRLTYTASGSDVQDETLNGVTQALRLGLMRYAVERGLGNTFEIEYEGTGAVGGGTEGDPGSGPAGVRDAWDYWTFQVGLSGDLDLRETATNLEFNPRFSADRVTEAWKLGFETEVSIERNRRELSGGREITDDRDEWELEGLIVRSISDHVSLGFSFSGESSVSENQDARLEIAPAAEYNYFPYAEANRRQLTLQYAAGLEHSNYMEETIFNVFEETRAVHEVGVRYSAREPWGNAGVGISYSQYLDDVDLFRAGLNGNLNFRITRGLDLNLGGSASWVRDEIHIPLSEISDEDILLGRQNLPSSYRYNGRIGLSYRWGSPFTNIVNARFGGQGNDWDD